jgi:hypothetical protein
MRALYLVQVPHGIIRRRRKRQIDTCKLTDHFSMQADLKNQRTHQWIASLSAKFLPQKLDYSLKTIGHCYLVEIRLHDRCIPYCFEADVRIREL